MYGKPGFRIRHHLGNGASPVSSQLARVLPDFVSDEDHGSDNRNGAGKLSERFPVFSHFAITQIQLSFSA